MKDSKTKDAAMIGPQIALQHYLDDLLQEATQIDLVDEREKVTEDALSENVDLEETLPSKSEECQIVDDGIVESVPLDTLDSAFSEFEAATIEELKFEEHKISLPNDDITLDTVEPEPRRFVDKTEALPWATGRFECLLFYVGGLKMAVPLIELGGIFQSDKGRLTSIFGQPDWFMGVANVGEFNLRCVDTARWVMPNHYLGELKENFKFVIQLDRSDWSLGCERVADAISLDPSQVKWRSDRSKRPWLAGTVIDHMCAILDVQGFIELLDDPNNGFKNHLK
ncbi:MAG: chemotaxis protein CheW [Marinomonas sp.]